MLLYADRQFVLYHCTFLRIYVYTAHFAFIPLYDSTHLRCYSTPTVSFVLYHCTSVLRIYVLRLTFLLHHCTILRIYDAAIRRLSVLFYTTVRFYASTMLLYADCQFCFIPLYVSTHLRCYYTPTVSFVLYHCTFLRIYVSTTHFPLTPLYDSAHLQCYYTPTVSKCGTDLDVLSGVTYSAVTPSLLYEHRNLVRGGSRGGGLGG